MAAPTQAGAVVAFGDSITDGTRSTPNTNSRWPDDLATAPRGVERRTIGVLNAGHRRQPRAGDGAGVSALARFDRDVLVQPGVTHVIVLEGINDIGIGAQQPDADGRRSHRGAPAADRARARARAQDLRRDADAVRGRGLLHARGRGEAPGAQRLDPHAAKPTTASIDFDAAVRDPGSPTKIQQQFNPGDNLHLNDAGYKAMADAIDLRLFTP